LIAAIPGKQMAYLESGGFMAVAPGEWFPGDPLLATAVEPKKRKKDFQRNRAKRNHPILLVI